MLLHSTIPPLTDDVRRFSGLYDSAPHCLTLTAHCPSVPRHFSLVYGLSADGLCLLACCNRITATVSVESYASCRWVSEWRRRRRCNQTLALRVA
nr:hypothetical protein Iba_chr05dCG10620 [Ipomoea batatas]